MVTIQVRGVRALLRALGEEQESVKTIIVRTSVSRLSPPPRKRAIGKSNNVMYGNSVASGQVLEASLLGVGTVLRLGRDAWLMVKYLRQATNEYPLHPPTPSTTPASTLPPTAPLPPPQCLRQTIALGLRLLPGDPDRRSSPPGIYYSPSDTDDFPPP